MYKYIVYMCVCLCVGRDGRMRRGGGDERALRRNFFTWFAIHQMAVVCF